MILWYAGLLITAVLTSVQSEKYIVMLKTPLVLHLGKREEGTSALNWALELAQSYDPDSFVGFAKSTITHRYNFGYGIIGFAITTTRQGIEAVARHFNVASWVLDRKIARYSQTLATSQSGSPFLARYVWHLDRINKRERNYDGIYPVIGNQGAGVTVYHFDTGIDTTHPELEKRAFVGPNFYGGKVEQLNTLNADPDGHGTHCAGIICIPGILSSLVTLLKLLFGGFGDMNCNKINVCMILVFK
jgi:hypothetical protein